MKFNNLPYKPPKILFLSNIYFILLSSGRVSSLTFQTDFIRGILYS